MGDVAQLGVLCDVEVVQDGTACDDGIVHAGDAEALEVARLEVLQQAVVGSLEGEHPVLEFKRQVTRRERSGKALAVAALDKYLLGREIDQQFIDVLLVALSGEELARADVEKRHSQHLLAEVDGSQEVVLLAVEHRTTDDHAGCHQFGDAALDELLGELGVFQLVTDGYALASPHQFGQVGVERMVGKARHLGSRCRTVAASCQSDAQYFAGSHSVFQISLIEVSHTEQQYGVGMLGFHLDELLHHWRIQRVLCHLYRYIIN